MTGQPVRWGIALLGWLFPLWLAAQSVPVTIEDRLELGLGVGALLTPDYRGSRTYRHLVAPVPYFIYRGEIFRSDRDGLRGDLFRSDQLEFTLSLSASLRPDSDDNERRAGMPALASSVEAGPALNVNLTGQTLHRGWMVTLPLRAVVTVGRGSPEHIGWLVEPQLTYRLRRQNWSATFRTGPVFASDAYHDYYYRVSSGQAHADRTAYDPAGGYSGYNNQLTLSRRGGDFWYGLFVRYYHLHGATFLDSPLVETHHGGTAGVAVSWVFF